MSEIRRPDTDEIDLFTFLKPVGKAIKDLFTGTRNYIRLLYNHFLLLIALILVFAALGFCVRFILPGLYRTEAVLSSHEIPSKLCILMLNNLQEMSATKKNKSVLAKSLNITAEQAATVSTIEAALMKDSFFVNDKDTVRNFFSVTLKCSNPAYIKDIQNGIVYFLESNDFAIKRKEGKQKMMLELKKSLEAKVKGLDSVKKLVNSSIVPRSTGQGIILGEPVNPVSVYEAEVNYYRELIEIERIMAMPENIEVVQPFIATVKPNFPRFNLILLIFAAAGLALAMIVIPLRAKKQTI